MRKIQQIRERVYDITDDFYTFEGIEEYIESDVISATEEAFMHGYLEDEDECCQ